MVTDLLTLLKHVTRDKSLESVTKSSEDSTFLIPMSKYKDNIIIDLESRIGGSRLNLSGSGQQNVMDLFQFIDYPKNY